MIIYCFNGLSPRAVGCGLESAHLEGKGGGLSSYPPLLQVGENVLISGWSRLFEKGRDLPDILNVAFVPLITSEDCSNRYKTLHDSGTLILYNTTEAMVCAGSASGKQGLPMRNKDDFIALMSPPLFKNIELFSLLKAAIAIAIAEKFVKH